MSPNENGLPNENWQVQIYPDVPKITLEELKEWIHEGKIEHFHKVRIKNLNWIEAHKIPALKKSFEEKKKISSAPLGGFRKVQNPTVLETKLKIDELDTLASNPPKVSAPVDSAASIPFKLYEQKVLAKNNLPDEVADKTDADVTQTETKPEQPVKEFNPIKPKPKPVENKFKAIRQPEKSNTKSSLVKNTGVFLLGCILILLISWGGSYLWNFQLKTVAQIDEKSITEFVVLEGKLANDKVGLRLKYTTDEQKAELEQEIAKLDQQFNAQRKVILENYRQNQLNTEFNTTFYLSLSVLMISFLLFRIFFGHSKSEIESGTDNFQFKPVSKATENLDGEDSKENDQSKSTETETTNSPDLKSTEAQAESSENTESTETNEQEKTANCLLHREKIAKFFCDVCSNSFCEECPKPNGEIKNCCPFCQIPCTTVENKKPEKVVVQVIVEEKKAKAKVKTIENFTIYEYPDEKNYKVGVLTAFLISFLLSSAISILWVYKISPFLESRQNEITQNISTTEQTNSNIAPKSDSNTNVQSDNANTAANEPCIDPITRQPFECDEETRRALYEHTRKIKSVENAQKETKEKTDLILKAIIPTESPSPENVDTAKEEKQKAIDAERREKEYRELLKVFLGSFVILFGLILSTRFWGKRD